VAADDLAKQVLSLSTAEEIEKAMSKSAFARVSALEVMGEIDSTNSYLMARAPDELKSGHVCLAEQQTAGRGRQGRVWISPYGNNIYLSIFWRFSLELAGWVHVWNLRTKALKRKFKVTVADSEASSLDLSPDASLLAVGDDRGRITLWSWRDGGLLYGFPGHLDGMFITSIEFLPDGRRLATASWDHTVKFWDLEKKKLLVTYHNLTEGFLWTTPPDAGRAHGWFWTDRLAIPNRFAKR